MTGTSPRGIEPVRRLKVADSVAAQLESLITGGEYKPGDKLPAERVLAEQFGVGRSSMREAVRILEAGGLLRIDHGVGAFVVSNKKTSADPSLLVFRDFTVPELFEARLSLEPEAARLAAKRITPREMAELERIVDALADPNLSDEEFVDLDVKLHRAIVGAAKNGLLQRLLEMIEPLFLTYSRRVIQLPGRRAHAHTGHQRIVEAIIGRRARDARNAAVRHIRDVERDIVEHLDQTGDRSL